MIENKLLHFLDETLKGLEKFKGFYNRDLVCFEMPKDPNHGNLSTNIAFRLAKVLKTNPAETAKEITEAINRDLTTSLLAGSIEKVEHLNGFINFRLSAKCLHQTLFEIYRDREEFGSNDIGRGERVLIEFVSANPTGSLSVAHARQAAFGDSLANLLALCGYGVTREYYINDEGVQISLLGQSIYARYKELLDERYEFPVDGYRGAYIRDIAQAIYKAYGNKLSYELPVNIKFCSDYGVDYLMKVIKQELSDFGAKFDNWYSQRALSESGKIEGVVSLLQEKEYIYEQDGALWFKSTLFGDDKDRVVKKGDGTYTYVMPDVAYHKDKFERGFNRLIDIFGPDHHGYINRMKAAVRALGYKEDQFFVIIIQLATLYKGGKPVRMSTRAGEYITLRELLSEVGKDAARFFLLMRKASAHLDFDLELAKKQTPENPVYYVQYAHARICSISALAKASPEQTATLLWEEKSEEYLEVLNAPEELDLLRELRRFPMAVRLSAQELDPYRIVLYLQELAASFHKFYETHKVLSDNLVLSRARLFLVDCVRQVLANGLKLLGVSCPNKM